MAVLSFFQQSRVYQNHTLSIPMSAHGRQVLHTYKAVVIGGGGVGKSSLTIQFIQSVFVEDYDPTMEDSYRKKLVVDNEVAILDILDTAGQGEYRAMLEQYMRVGEGFLIVYSITDRASFEETLAFRQQILHVKDRDSFPIIVVANKSDLENERQVSTAEGQEMAKQWNCEYIETSAKDRINVDETFYSLVGEMKNYTIATAPVNKEPKSSEDKTKGNGKSDKCLIS